MSMPVMDGWAFAAAYRQLTLAPASHAPVVCMTAALDVCRRAAEIGAAAALSKPFELTELLETVERLAAA